jgi:hypothetical protein
VAFLAPDYNLIFYFNRIVDVGFFIDIFLNFHLGYLHPSVSAFTATLQAYPQLIPATCNLGIQK